MSVIVHVASSLRSEGTGFRGNQPWNHTASYRFGLEFCILSHAHPRIVSSRAMATGPTWSGSERRSSLTRHVRHSQGVLQPLCRCTLSSANDAVALWLRYSAAATWTGLGETGLTLPIPGRAAAAPCCLCSPSGVALHAVVADGGYMERWIMAERGQVPAAGMDLEAGNLVVLHEVAASMAVVGEITGLTRA
jgi:hypothetical protein